MNNIRIKNVFLSGILLFFCGASIASTALENKVRGFLQQQVENTNAPSLSVSAGHNGKVLFSVAAGVADKSTNSEADMNTQYRTGSVSKVIGTTAFMPLLQDNKVTLDDKVTTYLPYLPKHYQPIQLKHILTHTSGIRHYRFGEYGTNIHYPTLKVSTEVFRDDALLFKPGTDYMYTTYGINLLQGVIEKISGEGLSDYLQSCCSRR